MSAPVMAPQRNPPAMGPISADAFYALVEPSPGVRRVRRLGLGTAGIAGVWGPSNPEEATRTMHAAWSSEYELLDTAPAYASAEILVQRALKTWRGRRPVIATKTKQGSQEVEAITATYAESRARLGSIDMLALHDLPLSDRSDRSDLRDWVRRLLESGEIRAAGLGGGGPAVQAGWLRDGGFGYVITYNRLDAVTLQGLGDTVPQAHSSGAAVIAASPLHVGLLGPRGAIGRHAAPSGHERVWHDRAARVRALAQESGVPLTHLALRFILSMPFVDLLLTGAATASEWLDCQRAYESGPLPADLYAELWRNALKGAEPPTGG